MPDEDKKADFAKYIATIKLLQQHRDKNFVQRLLHPKDYPVMQNVVTKGGVGTGTHLMSSAEVEGKNIAYPEIVQDPKTKELKRLRRKEAVDYAVKTGEYIPFDTQEEAKDFGANYKKYLHTRGY